MGHTLKFIIIVLFRNIKPDNILLCANGHAHLADFILATRVKSDKSLTVVVGSTTYSAPEMLKGTGYNGGSVDWWSIGVRIKFSKSNTHQS